MERVGFRIANDIVQVVSSAYAGIGECREKDEIRQNKGEMGGEGFGQDEVGNVQRSRTPGAPGESSETRSKERSLCTTRGRIGSG